ncbi:hypothetical protein [Aerococcus urinaeequi]|uniref:hypothetical protein n=1 Tax=Aerococcus urinaeequi TaxID=51665 RepID=UPI003D6A89B0
MKKIYYLFAIVFSFLLVYYPPVISINMLHIVGAISWVYIFLNMFKIYRYFNMEIIAILYILIFSLMVYLSIVAIANGNSVSTANKSLLYWAIDIIPASVVIADLLNRKINTKSSQDVIDKFFTIIMIIGVIQAVLSIIAFLNPNFQAWFISQMVNYGYEEARFTALAAYRWYGVSSNLGMTTSVVQAFIAVIMIFLAIESKLSYIFAAFILFFSSFINSRNSFVVLAIGILLIILMNLNTNKISVNKILKVLFIFLIIGTFATFLMYILAILSPRTYEWLINGITEFIQLIFGSYSTDSSYDYVDYITNSNVYTMPPKISGILFGTGQYANGSNSLLFATDVGYVNDIWLGGLVYVTFLYSLFLSAIIKLIKYFNNKRNKKYLFITLFFLSQFLIQNVKGFIFSTNDFSTLFILFFVITFMKERNSDATKENAVFLTY